MKLISKSMNSKRTRKAVLWGVSCAAVASLVVAYFPVPPHGRFSMPQIGNTAHAYVELSGGKISTVVFAGERGREGAEVRKVAGNYYKEHGCWILGTGNGGTAQIHATLLSLTIVHDDGKKDGPFYRYEVWSGR